MSPVRECYGLSVALWLLRRSYTTVTWQLLTAAAEWCQLQLVLCNWAPATFRSMQRLYITMQTAHLTLISPVSRSSQRYSWRCVFENRRLRADSLAVVRRATQPTCHCVAGRFSTFELLLIMMFSFTSEVVASEMASWPLLRWWSRSVAVESAVGIGWTDVVMFSEVHFEKLNCVKSCYKTVNCAVFEGPNPDEMLHGNADAASPSQPGSMHQHPGQAGTTSHAPSAPVTLRRHSALRSTLRLLSDPSDKGKGTTACARPKIFLNRSTKFHRSS
jgi:hypothetical protein